jgi:hypothetical protein
MRMEEEAVESLIDDDMLHRSRKVAVPVLEAAVAAGRADEVCGGQAAGAGAAEQDTVLCSGC